MDFYKCKHCGNIITYLHASGVKVFCCGEEMMKLTANTTDAATEKHIPAISQTGNLVHIQVGDVIHPMEDVHYIEWIALETTDGQVQIKYLHPHEAPAATFCLVDGDKIARVYAYCNLHGLWVKDMALSSF